MNRQTYRGMAFGILSAIAYGLNPFFALPLYAAEMSPETVLFFRYLLASLLLGGIMLIQRKPLCLPRGMLLPTAGAAVLIALSSISLFRGIAVMDSGIVATILFVYPVMVAGIMSVMFHEPLTRLTIAGLVLALAGVVLLCLPDAGAVVTPFGIICGLVSALTYAVYIVAVRASRLRRLPPDLFTLYVMLFGVLVFLVPLRGGMDLRLPPDWHAWGNIAGLALLPSLLAFLLLAMAIRRIGPTRTAILGVLEPLTAVAIGIGVFGEAFGPGHVIGILLIIGAVLCVVCPPRRPAA